MKQTFLLLLPFLIIACENGSNSSDEDGWELFQSIKYENSLDKAHRIIETKESIYLYSGGQEQGNKLTGLIQYNYDSNNRLIAERHFDIENAGGKILSTEVVDYYNENGLHTARSYKKYGLLIDSIIKSYDDAKRLKIEAILSIRNRPDNTQDVATLISQGTISYDTTFLYHIYDNQGVLSMQKVLDNRSKVLSTNHYTYVDNKLDRTYRVSNSNDTLDKLFYEYENDGTLKETSLISGQDFTSTTWKKGDKLIKELSIGAGYKSMRKYIYDKKGHLIEERIFF
jgi:hypothetical protein